jgi:predicted RND superfamily exporter protein
MRRYAVWVTRYRIVVISLTVLITAGLVSQVRHLRLIIDPNAIVPQEHPYVAATTQADEVFGSKNIVVIGITPKEGDAYQPRVLEKVQRITAALYETPGVVKANLLSLAARRVKNIAGTDDGLEVRPLMETVPQTPDAVEALRRAVRLNPVYLNAIVSRDERTAAILVKFKDDRGGFRGMIDKVRPIVERERDPAVEIAIGGLPVFLAQLETYSQRMAFLFPLAVFITGLIHYEAFRTFQGLILPLVTALVAVAWGLGAMGLAGVPLDVFNVTTPILILAVAAGHAVQIL